MKNIFQLKISYLWKMVYLSTIIDYNYEEDTIISLFKQIKDSFQSFPF